MPTRKVSAGRSSETPCRVPAAEAPLGRICGQTTLGPLAGLPPRELSVSARPLPRASRPTRPGPGPRSPACPTHRPPRGERRDTPWAGPTRRRNLSARGLRKPEGLMGNPCVDPLLPRSPRFPRSQTLFHSDPWSCPCQYVGPVIA